MLPYLINDNNQGGIIHYAQSCEICIFRRDYVINHLQHVQSNVLQ